MAWEISTRTPVRASPSAVWDVLTAFETYPEWNPTLTRVEGTPELGERLRLTASLPSLPSIPLVGTVIVLDPERELRWETKLPPDGVVALQHAFVVETDGETVLEQRARFEGALAKPLMERVGADVRAGLEAMNRAVVDRLDRRVEG